MQTGDSKPAVPRRTYKLAVFVRAIACLSLPPANDLPPRLAPQLIVFPLVFIPWLVLYEWVVYRGPQAGSFETYLPGELDWPIWQWMEIPYVSPYVIVTFAPFFATTNRLLRRFVIAGLGATLFVDFLFITIPALATPRPFEPHGILGRMMMLDREMDRNNGTASCPSFHIIWALLGAALYANRYPRWRWAFWLWAIAVGASCIFTGMHSLIDILLGAVVFLLFFNYPTLWRWIAGAPLAELVPVETEIRRP